LPLRSIREVIILQPDVGVGFTVIFGDIARRSKTSWKMSVAHGASKHLGTRPFKIEAASLVIVVAPMMRVPRAWSGLRAVIP
jgi:hypothetical protein